VLENGESREKREGEGEKEGKRRKDRGGEVHYIWMHIRWRMDF